MSVTDCANTILEKQVVARQRRRLLAELSRGMNPIAQVLEYNVWPTSPAVAYRALFAEELDPWLVARIQETYDLNAWSGLGRPGFIYVFRDERDPPNVVKIGATRQRTAERRLSQWQRELGDADGTNVNMLFSHQTKSPFFAEAILHDLFWCRQLTARINRRTNKQLVEYFSIADRISLRHLCHAVVRHVDAFVSAAIEL